jgi:hypothetical protein
MNDNNKKLLWVSEWVFSFGEFLFRSSLDLVVPLITILSFDA